MKLKKLFGRVVLSMAAISMMAILMSSKSSGEAKKNKDRAIFKKNELMARGVNLPSLNSMEDIHFKRMREAGFTNVRLPIGPFRYVKDTIEFKLDPAFFTMLDKVVKLSLDNKMLTIIDFHEHTTMQKNPVGLTPKFLACWRQIADHYKDYPDEVMFEIANEPNMKPEIWNNLHSQAYKILRESNPNRTLLIGPINGNQIKYLKDLILPEDDRNIIVTIHYYMPIQFTHQGAQWSEKNKNLSGIEWPLANDEQAIKDDFDIAQEWSKKNNRPLHLGEFGTYEKAGMESRLRYTNFVAREVEKRNWSWSYWELNQGFGFFNLKTLVWNTDMLNALIPPKK